MSEYRQLNTGDVLPASFINALEQFIGAMTANINLTLATTSSVQIVADTGNAQASLGIDGLWRYISSTATASVTGSAGVYDIFATTGDNSFATSPTADTDNTNYAFALVSVAHGATPGGVAHYRKIGEVDFDGAKITGLRQVVGLVSASQIFVPAGAVFDFGGTVAPAGYLLCNGVDYAMTDYPLLYGAIGTTHNTAGGLLSAPAAGRFRVPYALGRATIGAGSGSGLSARTLGDMPGHETEAAPVASHGHTTARSTTGLGISVTVPDHAHTFGGYVPISNSNNWFANTFGGGAYGSVPRVDPNVGGIGTLGATVGSGALTASVGVSEPNGATGHSHTVNADGTGSKDGVHANVQPSIVLTKIIKY